MFNLFRKKKENREYLKNWHVDVGPGFQLIVNEDSIQYHNDDESKVLYFSILKVKGPLVTGGILSREPKIINDANAWRFEGAKSAADEVLVCVLSFKNENDVKWAKDLFNSIQYKP